MTTRSRGPQSPRRGEAMSFDGMLVSILLTYSLPNERSQSRSRDYALGVAHNTSCILQLSPPLAPTPAHWHAVFEKEFERARSFS